MSCLATVETSSRLQTSSLLRKLRGHNAYAIQIGAEQWLVRSPACASDGTFAAIQGLLGEWAAEQGMQTPSLRLDDVGDVH